MDAARFSADAQQIVQSRNKDNTMKHTLTPLTALLLAVGLVGSVIAQTPKTKTNDVAPLAVATVPEDLVLNYHLMHPGGETMPADPNAAFYLDGTYHLHYILEHPWKEKKSSYSFVHVTSPDMLHWTWQTTKLQPSFTGHDVGGSGTSVNNPGARPGFAVPYYRAWGREKSIRAAV